MYRPARHQVCSADRVFRVSAETWCELFEGFDRERVKFHVKFGVEFENCRVNLHEKVVTVIACGSNFYSSLETERVAPAVANKETSAERAWEIRQKGVRK